jgi:hypothetical protein
MAYYSAVSNPFLKFDTPMEASNDHSRHLLVGSPKWKNFRLRVDEISRVVGSMPNTT